MSTPKVQILGALYKQSVEEIKESLANKVDKRTSKQAAYINDGNGNVNMMPYSPNPISDALATYSAGGRLGTLAPKRDIDCVNKAYVDPIKKKVDKLEGTLIKYTEDSSESYSKKVPVDAAQKAVLNRVGGKTIKKGSKNICTDAVEGGIPITHSRMQFMYRLPPGTYWFKIWTEVENIKDTATISIVDCFNGEGYYVEECWSNPMTFTKTELYQAEINVFGNYPEKSGKFYIMISEEEIDPEEEYEPYVAPSIEHTKVTEIISKSANIIPFPYINGDVVKGNGYKKTNINGLTWSIDAIGRIKVNGTATARSYLTFINGPYLPDGEYELSGCPFGGGENTYSIRVSQNGKVIGRDDGNGGLMTIPGDHQFSAHICISEGTTVTNLVFYPQLRRIIRYPIPEEISSKEWYGTDEGYVDFDRKIFGYGDTEEDVSRILDYPNDYKLIEVDGGGELIAANENKNPVPWTVTFAEV